MITFFSKKLDRIAIAKPSRSGRYTTLAVALGIFSVGGAYADAVVKNGEMVAVDRIYQLVDKDLVTVTFEGGSAELSKESISALSDFVKTTNGEAAVDRFIVAAWADKAYPEKGELSEPERKLAAMRSRHIKQGLSAAGATNVDAFEMTKQPNWIQRAFSTETADIKGKGRSGTAHERLLKEISDKIREKGGPRTAVVVAKFRNEVLSE